jgi:MFS family permease
VCARLRRSLRTGDIAVAFFVLGAPVALLVGALTDSFNRRNLFVAVIALGEGPCLATAYVRTYRQLFAMRTLTGISIGGSMPLLYSLVGDLVPPQRRSAVSAGVGIAQGAGIAVGQIVAGYLGATHGWRLPFVVVAVPALLLALAVLLCVEEPRRGAQEAAFAQGSGSGGGGADGGGGSGGEYRERIEWRKVKHVAAATSMVVVFGAGSVAGSLLGGAGGQWLYNVTPGALGWLMAVTTAAGALPLLYVVNAASLAGASGMAFLGGLLSCVTGACVLGGQAGLCCGDCRVHLLTQPARHAGTNVRAVLIGVNAPETRGTAFAIFNLMVRAFCARRTHARARAKLLRCATGRAGQGAGPRRGGVAHRA